MLHRPNSTNQHHLQHLAASRESSANAPRGQYPHHDLRRNRPPQGGTQ